MSITLLWKILFYGWFAGEIALVVVTRTRRKDGHVRDRGSMLILWLTIFFSITAAESIPPMLPASVFLHGHGIRYAAFAAMIAGLLIRWTAIFSLGKAFSVNVAIRATQTLYRAGLYRVVRHPSYSGMMLCLVSVALSERNWISAAVLLLPTTAALLYRIHVEEAALREGFGAEYAAYCQQTRRLIPGIY